MNIQGKNAERRLITVLFADLSNFTALCHQLDPEDSVKITNICFEYINKIIVTNGGMIHKYEGDAVMSLFSFPVTYEDAPERAVKTALQLVAEMPKINEAILAKAGTSCELGLHVGIHSGLAVVAEVGSDEKKEYTVMGNTVNLASRLKDLAPTGLIYVSEQIYKATRYLLEYKVEGRFTIKGIDDSVVLYRPLKLREIPGAKRGIKGLYSPLVGRDEEFGLIKKKLGELTAGGTGIVFITGDAGLGKSRLWQETKNYIEDERVEVKVLEGQCLYHGEHLSYWPILQILEQIYGITEKDTPQAIKEKIVSWTRETLPEDWEDVAPYIGNLFSIEFTDGLAEKVKYLDPRDLQIKVLGAIKALLQAIAAKNPVLLVIEDYHWIDSVSLEFIQFMFGSPDTADLTNVMLLCLSRERKEKECFRVKKKLAGVLGARFAEIRLKPLDNYSSLELTYNLLEIPGFTKDFKNKVLTKAEGNPFFIEEIINSLIDSGVLYFETGMWKQRMKVEEIEIPDTIQLVIAARLDRLQESLKSVLQMASVIGRTFYKSILARIHEDKKRLLEYLETLEDYEFILQMISSAQSKEDIEYMFKHPLIQQVTYTSLLKTKRKKLHRIVAEAMETLYKDRIDDYVGLIAQQYANSDDFERAVHWLLAAGKKAKASYANEDALEYYKEAITIVNKSAIVNKDALVAAFESIGDIYKNIGKNAESIDNYTRILKITDDALTHVKIIRKIGETYENQSQYEEALGYLAESKTKLDDLKEAEPRTDDTYHRELHLIYHALAWVNYLMGDFEQALSYCEQSLAEVEDIADKKDRSLSAASTYNVLGSIKGRTGYTEESYQFYKKAEKLYDEEGNLPGVGTIYNNIVNYFSEKGDFIRCIEYLEKSVEISAKIGNSLGEAISSYNLGSEYLNLGNYGMAKEYIDRYQKLNKLIGNRLGEGWANEGYSVIYFEKGLPNKALDSINTSIDIFQKVHSKIKEMGAKLHKADLLIDIDRPEDARGLLEEVEEYAVKNSVTDLIVSIHISRGKLLLKQDGTGKGKAALAEFGKAEKMVKQMGWVSALAEIYYYMGQAAAKEADSHASTEYYNQARKILADTAEKIADKELKQSFLAKSFNKKILSA